MIRSELDIRRPKVPIRGCHIPACARKISTLKVVGYARVRSFYSSSLLQENCLLEVCCSVISVVMRLKIPLLEGSSTNIFSRLAELMWTGFHGRAIGHECLSRHAVPPANSFLNLAYVLPIMDTTDFRPSDIMKSNSAVIWSMEFI